MNSRKKIWLVIACIVCLGTLGACGKQEEPQQTIVYEFGDSQISYGEFYIYARTVQEDYQKIYGEGIWSLELTTDDGSKSMRDVTIEDIVSDINHVKVLVAQAPDLEIELDGEEKEKAAKQAEDFYSGLTKKDIASTELTRDIVETVICENMLAQKVYEKMIAECDYEISDEEARMTTFYDIVFECYKAKKDGTVEEFTDEKKATQLEKANEALSSLAQGEDITYESIVDTYDLPYSSSHTMSKAEIVEEYGEAVADKILALSDGEVSSVITSKYGYHIFKMLTAQEEELTKKHKQEIILQMKKEYFNEIYKDWEKKYDSHFNIKVDVDMQLLEEFPFDVK